MLGLFSVSFYLLAGLLGGGLALIGDGRAYRDCKKRWVCLPMGLGGRTYRAPILMTSWVDRGYEGREEEKNQDVAFLGCLSFSICDIGSYLPLCEVRAGIRQFTV